MPFIIISIVYLSSYNIILHCIYTFISFSNTTYVYSLIRRIYLMQINKISSYMHLYVSLYVYLYFEIWASVSLPVDRRVVYTL